jgi:hypothetical protein
VGGPQSPYVRFEEEGTVLSIAGTEPQILGRWRKITKHFVFALLLRLLQKSKDTLTIRELKLKKTKVVG